MKLAKGNVLWLALTLVILSHFLPCSHQDIFLSRKRKNTQRNFFCDT